MDLQFLHKLRDNLVKHKESIEDVMAKYQVTVDNSREICFDDLSDSEFEEELNYSEADESDSENDELIVEEDIVHEDEDLAKSQHFFGIIFK